MHVKIMFRTSSSLSFAQTATPVAQTYAIVHLRFCMPLYTSGSVCHCTLQVLYATVPFRFSTELLIFSLTHDVCLCVV